MLRKTIQAYREAFAGVPGAVWMLAGVMLVSRSGMMVLPFLTLYLTQEWELSVERAGWVVATWSAAGIVGTYCGGWLCGRIGAIRVVLLSLLLSVPGFLVMPHCPNILLLCVALAYQGVVMEAGRPACQTAATLLCPPEMHAKSLAVLRLALNLGFTVGPTIGGILAQIDFHLLFYVNAAFMLMGAAIGAYCFQPWRKAPLLSETETTSTDTKPLRDKLFVGYLALQFFAGLMFFQLLATMPLTWRDRYGFDEPLIGAMFAINTIVIVTLEMLLIRAINHIAPLRLIAVGTGLVGIGFGMTALGTSLPWAVVAVLVWTAGEMLAAPYGVALVAQRSSSRNRGAYMGYFAMCFSAANVAAPIIGTTLYGIHPDLPWWSCFVVGSILPFGFLRLLSAQTREQQQQRETHERSIGIAAAPTEAVA